MLPDGFTIKYQDEEKDLISVTSDLELQEVRMHASVSIVAHPPTGRA